MNILITTGIYPPKIGGPAQYAKNLQAAFTQLGHRVQVKTFRLENYLPTGLRHLYFLIKILPAVARADFVLTLDTFSVGLPTVAAGRLLDKKVIIRTGGDFLWENYVERTGDLVLLSKFYQTSLDKLSPKEKIIFQLTRWTLHQATKVVFSTDWQRQIWLAPYQLDLTKTAIVENYYGPKIAATGNTMIPQRKVFISGTRSLRWKNKARLHRAFNKVKIQNPGLVLDDQGQPYDKFLDKLKNSYAVILVSLGDISPNLILDALRFGRPFILTRENGLSDRLADLAILVDPEDEDDIAEKILWLASEANYRDTLVKIEQFNFIHSWSDIANELISLTKL